MDTLQKPLLLLQHISLVAVVEYTALVILFTVAGQTPHNSS